MHDWEMKALQGKQCVIGVDEVGRGAIAGPLVACAVCLDISHVEKLTEILRTHTVRDSKKMTERMREETYEAIKCIIPHEAVFVTSQIIDTKGIQKANINALTTSVHACIKKANAMQTTVFVDYHPIEAHFRQTFRAEHIVQMHCMPKADSIFTSVMIASICAKVIRDTHMRVLADEAPEYLWQSNKGYGTSAHIHALREHGPSKEHRRTFIRNIR